MSQPKSPPHSQGLRFRQTRLARSYAGVQVLRRQERDRRTICAGMHQQRSERCRYHRSQQWILDRPGQSRCWRAVVVFPGAEITCMGGKEGIHIIALLDPSCGRVDIEGLLGALGLKPGELGESSSLVQKDPINVIDIINKQRRCVRSWLTPTPARAP